MCGNAALKMSLRASYKTADDKLFNVFIFTVVIMFPTPTGKWETIFQSGKSQGILNVGKSLGNLYRTLEKSGNFRQFLYF